MSKSSPLVSVILPVYNSEKYLGESIAAILNQSFHDFEFIIINDGSKDKSEEKILEFNDPRIKYIKQQNAGLAGTLNNGIALAKGKYIARQDHDDISSPDRLQKQVDFMESHPDVGLLGTWAEIVDEDGKSTGQFHKHPTENHLIKFQLLFNNPFVHSSVMIRKEVLERSGLYDLSKDYFEDHNLWSRMSMFTQMANLPEVLLKYRELNSSMSRVATDYNQKVANQSLINLKPYAKGLTQQMIQKLVDFYFNKPDKKVSFSELDAGYETVMKNFATTQRINPLLLSFELKRQQLNARRFYYNFILSSESASALHKFIVRFKRNLFFKRYGKYLNK